MGSWRTEEARMNTPEAVVEAVAKAIETELDRAAILEHGADGEVVEQIMDVAARAAIDAFTENIGLEIERMDRIIPPELGPPVPEYRYVGRWLPWIAAAKSDAPSEPMVPAELSTPEKIEVIKGFLRRNEPAVGDKDNILQAYSDLWLAIRGEAEAAEVQRDKVQSELEEALDVIQRIIAVDQKTTAGELAFLDCQAVLRKHKRLNGPHD